MADMVNVLMLSKWHVHAGDYAKTVKAQPDARITCVWDDDAERGAEWAKDLGVDFEPNLDKALARADVDAVVVDTATSDHLKVMIAAANAGKHIFTEKALAPTVEECEQIAEAVAKNGVKFCISHPNLTTPLAQYCKQAIDDGLLGRITYMRMRSAHDGSLRGWLPSYWYDVEKAGGGAMMDLGCHPMYTAAYLLGKPKRIASIFNTTCAPAPADDNAVSVVEFENNAIAVLETGFVSPYNGNFFELLGTEGAVTAVGDQIKARTNQFKDGWFIPDKKNMPEARPAALRQWLDGILYGKPIPFDIAKGIALTELLENAYKSHNTQTIVKIG
ncbi:MAG: Gfo/Idh/MocA family oxidoreductase [Oscillospiraceae bacterium]|jgi:predicted dehydrogenase|nr:Gfo/Idh/MocA family oxidoreductase [Oscillospiraceae bacterium]